ncbi:DUF2273 domain-containing protein [Humibacter sp. BT305]|uniref:Uncharacterized protein n=1 Tax=Cnuibacter physcomitrellae TaxID=1619308 RepID=A0A1X9LLW6_9MICO|nr:DUF2273 domain-containing protein [Cnuibacter physcomitrellae]ARJ04099.1 hypothetical protein B5808_01825 [Cnuibacter physcomitrellae]AXH34174.1 DUF2273 domain-containing protein [Humibacter sp. BT305]MCS5497147.1 DUF2273 domain-containing protein [Cnuibacter physcomitrellae]GGI40262.1 hypothetical protein GCM10010988_28200 [Cnuibacter physcomitrellae]
MSATATGALMGAVLAAAALLFGFWGFLLVALFMAIGAVVARVASGQLDLRALAGVFTGRRTS